MNPSAFSTAAPAAPTQDASASAGAGKATASALARIYRMYAAARMSLGAALLLAQAVTIAFGARPSLAALLICPAYAGQALALWVLPRLAWLSEPQAGAIPHRRQWLATIGVDLLAFTLLHALESGLNFNFGALLVLPVLMAGVTSKRLIALGTAAAVTLLLLAVAAAGTLVQGSDEIGVKLAQSGLAGIGFFAISLLAGELATRLVGEQQAARGSLAMAREQEQLNRMVIEEMGDGVLVVDPRLRVRAANPAARSLLAAVGMAPPAPFELRGNPAWAALADAVERAQREADWPEAGRDIGLRFGPDQTRNLRLRARFTRPLALEEGIAAGEPHCLLLLEDVRTAQSRQRQEKLAAMGRMSAGIAHEIRNPLAAISQANALLLEDALSAPQRRLAEMVADNAKRLKGIVNDVMELAAGPAPAARTIDAVTEVAAVAAEWAHTVNWALAGDSRLQIELPPAPLWVQFDPDHLRRVIVNLLDNAGRHASARSGAVLLQLQAADDGVALLRIGSDGPPIGPEVEPYLFEPFYSTRSRGTGLGLYICRELCARYGAGIEYRLQASDARWRNQFEVAMRSGNRAVADA